MLPPSQSRVGDQQNLEFTPPDVRELGGGAPKGVDGVRGRDLRVVDVHTALQLVVGVVPRHRPAHTSQHILASEEQSLLEPGGHHGREARPEMGSDRRCQGRIDDALEMLGPQVPDQDVGDHRKHESAAVRRLLLPLALGPAGPAWWVACVGRGSAR